MTLFAYNNNPQYPDRYDRSKGWIRVLPVAGRPLQTSELIEIQSIIQDNLKQGFNTLFKNGAAISGLRMGVSSRSDSEVTLSITKGQIYVEGFVLEVSESRLNIPSQGSFSVGILIDESIITEVEDPSLRDPIKGGELYGPEGASRLVWTTSVLIDNPDSFVIGKVIDGVVNQANLNPFYQIETILAKQTYERSGHFCVSGYEASSLGASTRTVADRNKYSSLQSKVDSTNSDLQQTLSEAQSAKANLDNLEQQLSTAINNSILTPTSSNQALVADLRNRVNEAQAYYNSLANLLVTKQTLYQTSLSSLQQASNLLVDKELLNITPGVAYVEGYRVCKADPTTISVPKDLPTTSVDSAKFVYAGTPAKALRQILLATGATFSNVTADNTLFRIKFERLLYQDSSIDITISVNCSNPSIIDIGSLTQYVQDQVNENSNTIDSYITFTSTNITLSSLEARSVLKNNLVISRTGASGNTLEIISTSLNERANQIAVTIDSRARNSSNVDIGPGKLISDVPEGNLGGGGTSTTFQLGFRPVAEVLKLVAELQEDLKPIVRGVTPGTSDLLGDDSIFRIVRVVQGTTTYTEGTDFTLLDQSKISWNPSGLEPLPGTTYYVSFLYTQPLAINDDFILDSTTDSIVFVGRTPAVVYSQAGGVTTVYNGSFTVDYTYYLAKAGVITLDKDGNFGYILSSPSQDPLLPSVPDNLLAISSFMMYANSTQIKPLNCKRLTVEDQQILSERIRRNTQNIEILKLDLEAYRNSTNTIGEPPIGLFNEPLQDLSKLDLKHPLWSSSVIPATQSMSSGYSHKDVAIRYGGGGVVSKNETSNNSIVTMPFTNKALIKQSRATTIRQVPIYGSSVKRRAKMYLSQYTLFLNSSYSNLTPCDYLTSITSSILRQGSTSSYIQSIISSTNTLFSSAAEKAATSIISGNAINLIDTGSDSFIDSIFKMVKAASNIVINVEVEDLPPNSDNYRFYINNVAITTFTLRNSTPASLAYPGSIKAKADGTLSVALTLPPNLPTGVLQIEMRGDESYSKGRISIYNNLFNQITIGAIRSWGALPLTVSSTSLIPIEYNDFISQDLLRLGISNIDPGSIGNMSSLQVSDAITYPIRHSPINQTFEASITSYITGVKLRLSSGSTNGKLNVFLKEADVEPGRTTLAKGVATSYNYSSNSLLESTFSFPRPVLVYAGNSYSVSVEATSPGFNLYTSKLGERDYITGSTLGDQLYLQGSLYTSGDGVLVSEESREDLSYELERADFNLTDVVIDLGTYGISDAVTNITYFCLNSRDIVPKGTEIAYEYESTTNNWVRFQPNVTVCLPFVKQALKLRATLRSSISSMSPAICLEGMSVSFYSSLLTSQIISKRVTYDEAYSNIEVVVRYVKPVEASMKVFYSPTRGFSWEGPEWLELSLVAGSTVLVDPSIQMYESRYKRAEPNLIYILSELRKNFRYRVELNTTDRSKQAVIKNVITYVY